MVPPKSVEYLSWSHPQAADSGSVLCKCIYSYNITLSFVYPVPLLFSSPRPGILQYVNLANILLLVQKCTQNILVI